MSAPKHALPRSAPCPCGSGTSLGDCCRRYLDGDAPPTAEALMRSRYTAFVLGDDAYLLATWHPSTRPQHLDTADGPDWLRLEVTAVEGGEAGGSEGWVRFAAHYGEHGHAGVLRERSRFVREGGRWLYLEGALEPDPRPLSTPARNAPCPCGSGRKYKRCCGR